MFSKAVFSKKMLTKAVTVLFALLLSLSFVSCGLKDTLLNTDNSKNGTENVAVDKTDQTDKADQTDQPDQPTDAIASGVIEPGAKAPGFNFAATNGQQGSLSALKGKVVLINIWASWCGPCVSEMPEIARLKADYPELEVLAVNVSDDPTAAEDFIKENSSYKFTWIIDSDYKISDLYPSDYIPYTIIINKEGVISEVFTGSPQDPYKVYKEAMLKAQNG